MSATFNVSVIIPIYKAESYVRQAVESALAQPETAEVLLIEDGSPDASLDVCRALAREYPAVRVLQHPNGENRGAGASRNLGIVQSTCPYIAFLDADDYYLPDRFRRASEILAAQPDIDGVYEATQDFYESEDLKAEHTQAGTLKTRLNMLTESVDPADLFERMHTDSIGHFWVCSMTLRRTVFERAGLFDTHLRTAQDKVLIRKIAAVCRLAPGRFSEPVAMRRVHRHNRVTGKQRSPEDTYQIRLADWQTMIEWGLERLSPQHLVVLTLYFATFTVRYLRSRHPLLRLIPSAWLGVLIVMMRLPRQYPQYRDQAFVRRAAALLAFHSIYPPSLIRAFIRKLRRRNHKAALD